MRTINSYRDLELLSDEEINDLYTYIQCIASFRQISKAMSDIEAKETPVMPSQPMPVQPSWQVQRNNPHIVPNQQRVAQNFYQPPIQRTNPNIVPNNQEQYEPNEQEEWENQSSPEWRQQEPPESIIMPNQRMETPQKTILKPEPVFDTSKTQSPPTKPVITPELPSEAELKRQQQAELKKKLFGL